MNDPKAAHKAFYCKLAAALKERGLLPKPAPGNEPEKEDA